jgi:hypothetical protein
MHSRKDIYTQQPQALKITHFSPPAFEVFMLTTERRHPPPKKKTRAKIAKDASERWKRRKRKCMDAHGMDGRTDI